MYNYKMVLVQYIGMQLWDWAVNTNCGPQFPSVAFMVQSNKHSRKAYPILIWTHLGKIKVKKVRVVWQ